MKCVPSGRLAAGKFRLNLLAKYQPDQKSKSAGLYCPPTLSVKTLNVDILIVDHSSVLCVRFGPCAFTSLSCSSRLKLP